MALKSTIFKVELSLSDMNRNHYADVSLTLARHPSETDERMMLRILAYALHAHEHLEFCKGISNEEEATLWQKDLTGQIEVWIELGNPEEKRVRKACHKSRRVFLYTYGGRASSLWWEQNREALGRFENLTVRSVDAEQSKALAALAERNMTLQITLQDNTIWVSTPAKALQLEWENLQEGQ